MSGIEFGQAFNRLRESLIRLGMRKFGLPEVEAEDAACECGLRAWRHIHNYRDETGIDGFEKWIFTIFTNILRDSKKNSIKREVATDPFLMMKYGYSAPCKCATMSDVDLTRLSEHQRQVVEDRVDGYTWREIAERHRINIETVRRRLKSAVHVLRVELAG